MEDTPKKRDVQRKVRPSKLTHPEYLATDKRDYRPKLVKGATPTWDFSGENITPKD